MRLRVVVALAVASAVLSGEAQGPPQAPGTIRTGVTVVPLDVRVVDSRGNPVTDLTRDDFEILEDGKTQTIQHFSVHSFRADPELAAIARLQPGDSSPGIEPANRRVFLVMLGRGRHQMTVRGIDALTQFVRDRLLPQDQVALLAWNRATDFTTDHATLLRTIGRYRERHEKIETNLREWFSGLRAVYGSKEIPPHIQRDIDAVFAEARGLRPREVRPGQVSDTGQVARDMADNTQALLSRQIAAERSGESGLLPDYGAERKADLLDMEFEDYIAQAAETWQDLGGLYAGLEYLRHLDGEKHLVLFTAEGLRLPRKEDNVALAAAASDARITLNTIHTGGTVAAAPPRRSPDGRVFVSPVPAAGAVFGQGFAVQDLRLVAELTGGRAAAYTYADRALDRIDRGSRFQYLLGYSPSNSALDGRFRQVDVRVKRKGLTVLHRNGYFATRRRPLDRKQLVRASRIGAAGTYAGPIQDIKLTMDTPVIVESGAGRQLDLRLRVDVSRLTLTRDGNADVATLDVAVFLGDARRTLIRDFWQTVELKLTDAVREQWRATGAPVRIALPAPADARHVKVVFYDAGADLLGSAIGIVR